MRRYFWIIGSFSNLAPRLMGIKQKKSHEEDEGKIINSFVIFPQASEPYCSRNVSKIAYR